MAQKLHLSGAPVNGVTAYGLSALMLASTSGTKSGDDGDCVPFISWRGFVMICYNLCYNLCYLIYVIYIHIHIHIIM